MNYYSKYIRLYKVDYSIIEKKQALEICEKIKETAVLWGPCLYELRENENYLDILYVSKSPSYYIQENLLNEFHLWTIKSDEGGTPDFISGFSKYYKNNMKYNTEGFWECHENCFYQANELRVYGKSKNILEELKFFYPDKYEAPFSLNENFEYSRSENIVYRSSNDRLCIDKFGTQIETHHFKLSDNLFSDGELIDAIGYSRKLLSELNSYPAQNFKDIYRIDFIYKNKIVLRNELKGQSSNNLYWESKTNDNYHNCITTNFIRFEEAYNNKKIKTDDNNG